MCVVSKDVEPISDKVYNKAVKDGILLAIEYMIQKRLENEIFPKEVWFENKLANLVEIDNSEDDDL